MVVDMLVGACICIRNKSIKAKAISPPKFFFFFNSFLILKLNLEQPLELFYKKPAPKTFGIEEKQKKT